MIEPNKDQNQTMLSLVSLNSTVCLATLAKVFPFFLLTPHNVLPGSTFCLLKSSVSQFATLTKKPSCGFFNLLVVHRSNTAAFSHLFCCVLADLNDQEAPSRNTESMESNGKRDCLC